MSSLFQGSFKQCLAEKVQSQAAQSPYLLCPSPARAVSKVGVGVGRTSAGGRLDPGPQYTQRLRHSLSPPQGRLPARISQDYLANILFVVAQAVIWD